MVQVGTAHAAEFGHSGYELHYTHVAGDKTTVWVHSRFADIFLIPFLHNWLKLRPGTVSYTQLAAWCSSVPLNNAERVFLPKLCILVRQQDELLPISSCCTSHRFKPADLHHQQKTSRAQNPSVWKTVCVRSLRIRGPEPLHLPCPKLCPPRLVVAHSHPPSRRLKASESVNEFFLALFSKGKPRRLTPSTS